MQIVELTREGDHTMWVQVPADWDQINYGRYTYGREVLEGTKAYYMDQMGSVVLIGENGEGIVAFTNQEGNIEIFDILPLDESRRVLAEKTGVFPGRE